MFIELTYVDKHGGETARWVNVCYIKTFDEEACTVMLDGNIKPFRVSEESMSRLVRFVRDDDDNESVVRIKQRGRWPWKR